MPIRESIGEAGLVPEALNNLAKHRILSRITRKNADSSERSAPIRVIRGEQALFLLSCEIRTLPVDGCA